MSKLSAKSANGGAGLPIGAATNLFGKTGGAIEYDDSAQKEGFVYLYLFRFYSFKNTIRMQLYPRKKYLARI